jgi:pimeloyl-ACP methyl ester carboxylesterase
MYSYWDLSFNNYNYSYVEIAVVQGYSTLAIDRFGIGNSSHGDPLNVVQAQAEIEAMNAITTKLRHGTIDGIAHKFSKVVHVGHSFGSVQSYWLSALYPNNADGIVLTGWSGNGTFLPTTVAAWNLHNARLNQPLRFGNASNVGILRSFGSMGSTIAQGVQSALKAVGVQLSSQDVYDNIATTEVADLITGWNQTVTSLNYPSGYTTHSDFTANQFVFLQYGRYDPALGLLTEATKQPVTVGEILTIDNAPAKTSFSGPVLVITGQHDQPFCGGDCYATGGVAPNIPAVAAPQFPNASPFETYIQPETAHGINAHYNSTGAYKVIQSFLGAHELAA